MNPKVYIVIHTDIHDKILHIKTGDIVLENVSSDLGSGVTHCQYTPTNSTWFTKSQLELIGEL